MPRETALAVEFRPIEDLVPNPRNARLHSDEQVEQVARSIEHFGFTNPILVDEDGTIVAGHGRRLAAASIYERGGSIRLPSGRVIQQGTVPVIVADGWSEEQRRAYTLADNQLALNAEWDDDMLRLEIGELQGDGYEIGLIGFSDSDLAKILATGDRGLTDPDVVPEPPEAPVSRLGDIWQLGDHRIACGDSTSADTVALLLDGEMPHLMVTDPPYGVEYDAAWRNRVHRADGSLVGGLAVGVVLNDDRSDWREAWALFPGDVAYIWHAGLQSASVFDSIIASGFEVRSQIIWAKQQFAIGRGDYHWQHEPCWYAVRKGKAGRWAGDRKQKTVWEIDKPQRSETGHSTQKPVECMKRPIENNSKPGDAVYEPFSGSGSTIIAGEMTGRRVFAVELNPAYVDVAVRRWQEFTGKEAVLLSTGETFAETAQDRAASVAA